MFQLRHPVLVRKWQTGAGSISFAIAWVLRRRELTAAIVGARRPSQIEETAIAGDWNLSAEDIAKC